jgi:hypothetical protein
MARIIGLVEGFILSAIVCLFVSLQIATLVYTSYTTKTNTSLNNKSLFLLADQPHWYITCFPLRPFACLWF